MGHERFMHLLVRHHRVVTCHTTLARLPTTIFQIVSGQLIEVVMKRLLLSLCVITSLASARSLADDPPKQETKDPPRTALAAWDTAKSAKEPLAAHPGQAKTGCKPIPAHQPP